jgi:hypothetical protein
MNNLKNVQNAWTQAEQNWNRLSPKNQKRITIAVVVIVLGLFGKVFSPSPAPVTATVQNQANVSPQRILILNTEAGYSLWQQGDGCLIVKNITEGHLRAMGTDWGGFKDALKSKYGFKCVLSE